MGSLILKGELYSELVVHVVGTESLKDFLEDSVGVELLFLLGEWTLELKWQGSYQHYHQPGTTLHEIKVSNTIGSTMS